MAEVTTFICDAGDLLDDGSYVECENEATVTCELAFPGRGAPHHERAAEVALDLCDEHVTAWRRQMRAFVPDDDVIAGNGHARDAVCKVCGHGPTTPAGLAAHQRATGHKGRA